MMWFRFKPWSTDEFKVGVALQGIRKKGGEEEVFLQKPKIIAFCCDTPWVPEGFFSQLKASPRHLITSDTQDSSIWPIPTKLAGNSRFRKLCRIPINPAIHDAMEQGEDCKGKYAVIGELQYLRTYQA